MMPTSAHLASTGGHSKSSHPTSCSSGIGTHRNRSVHSPIRDVSTFEYRRNRVGLARGGTAARPCVERRRGTPSRGRWGGAAAARDDDGVELCSPARARRARRRRRRPSRTQGASRGRRSLRRACRACLLRERPRRARERRARGAGGGRTGVGGRGGSASRVGRRASGRGARSVAVRGSESALELEAKGEGGARARTREGRTWILYQTSYPA